MRKPKKPPSPFESAEAREAFNTSLRAAFTASRALTDFIEGVLRDNPDVEPLAAIELAAAAAREAEKAWAYFLRLSHRSFPDKVSLN
ncbi:MAG: hypothetical protein AB7V61_07745 [Methylocystis sp.]|uniref:hypothetical protein n=1 Tax=Methylocystis sp. TaxID=1911079 RepID=UPI003D0B8A9F